MKITTSLRAFALSMVVCVAPVRAESGHAVDQGEELLATSAQEAGQIVGQFHLSILDMMKRAAALGYQGRVEELRPIVDDAMDIKIFGARTVGRTAWNGWSTEQRGEFLAVYKEYVCATYAARFDGFSGQEFVTVGSRQGRRGQIVVETEVRQPSDPPIRLDYVMRSGDSGWGIVDIYLDSAVSEVAMRRSEFSSVLNRDGYEGLIAALQSKIVERSNQN